MGRKLVLIQGSNRPKARRRRSQRIENLDEDLLRRHPFLQKLVKDANEHADCDDPLWLAGYLVSGLQVDIIHLSSRNFLEIADRELREILSHSVELAREIRQYIDIEEEA